MDRLKIKLPSSSAYEEALELLRGQVQIFVASKKRNMLSTGSIPADLRLQILSLGGQVAEEMRYELEAGG